MYMILWEYIVNSEHQAEFEKVYGSNGEWTQLFKQSDGYVGSELLHDLELPERYITIDRWVSVEAFESFHHEYHTEYETIDAHCKSLTEREARLGGSIRCSPTN